MAHSEEVTLEDDFLQDGSRNLQERWTGETRFEMSPEHPPKQRKKSVATGVKRKGDEVSRTEIDDDDVEVKEDRPGSSQEPSTSSTAQVVVGGTVLPPVPEGVVDSPLTEALLEWTESLSLMIEYLATSAQFHLAHSLADMKDLTWTIQSCVFPMIPTMVG